MKHMHKQSGFTLIEIIVAMLVLGVGLVGLLGISGYTVRAASDNEKWTTARMLAVGEAQQLASNPLERLQQMAAGGGDTERTEWVNQEEYTIQWWLTPLGSSSDPVRVDVRVRYPGEGIGPPVSYTTTRAFFL